MPLPPYFVGKLDYHCEPEDDYTMILDAPLGFWDSKGEYIETPAGLVTDGASVRQLLNLPIIGLLTRLVLRGDQFTGPFRWPAAGHDGEYAKATESSWWRALRSPARSAADRRIREGALARYAVIDGVVHDRKPAARWQAWAVWALLRAAGYRAWMDDSSKARKSLANAQAQQVT